MGRFAVAGIVTLWVIPISILVNHIVPDPYMDEIFHVPQAQQYCKGNFRSWDPMITTPPGLYCLSLPYVASLFPGINFLQGKSTFVDACSTTILRTTNGVIAVICSALLYEIIVLLKPELDARKATLCAVVLALYPLHWFFTFLYYTDVASLTAVLAMYLACLKKKYNFSALLGALAVFIRQTNVIWMLFVACSEIIEITLGSQIPKVKADDVDPLVTNSDKLTSKSRAEVNLRKRKVSNSVTSVNEATNRSNSCLATHSPASGLLEEMRVILLRSWHLKWKLVLSFSPFFIVLVAFLAFICWNGGLVLGAKEAHEVSPHFAQIMYFSLVSTLAVAPLHFTLGQVADVFQLFWEKRLPSFFQALAAIAACFFSVHFFSLAHPYLLADNRHYPFYLWRKIIKAHWSMKYLLIPFYVYAWFSIFNALGKVKRKSWIFVYFLATAAVLVPAPLIEFRYYTIPFYILMLHSPASGNRSWILAGLMYIAINVFTMIMFLFRPFHWDHEPGIQRFIW